MTNISITLYDGSFDVSFDCCGATRCRHALCAFMPPEPEDDEGCIYRQFGSCRCPEAQIAVMESIRRRLAQQINNAKLREGEQ